MAQNIPNSGNEIDMQVQEAQELNGRPETIKFLATSLTSA